MSKRFDFGAIKPDAVDMPLPTAEETDAVAERHGFVSREPAARVTRTRIKGPIEVLSIKGPLDVMNRFKTFCNEEGHMSYWSGIDALLKRVKR